MDNQNQNLIASIEAILFSYGEPIETNKIMKLLNSEKEAVKKAISELEQQYNNENRGLKIIFSDNKIQLASKPEFSKFLEEFAKEEFNENLTPAALETLALIIYFTPISRAKIDYFRGVNSNFILRSLLMRGLIERANNSQDRSYSYQPTFDLLKYLGISKIEELPDYQKFKEVGINFENTNDIII